MSFDLQAFLSAPSQELLNLAKTSDLLDIAAHYELTNVNKSMLKQEIKNIFGSVVRALDFYPGGPGSIPTAGARFFQLCFIPLLRLSCRKMGARPG